MAYLRYEEPVNAGTTAEGFVEVASIQADDAFAAPEGYKPFCREPVKIDEQPLAQDAFYSTFP
jgi:hypothetical protein